MKNLTKAANPSICADPQGRRARGTPQSVARRFAQGPPAHLLRFSLYHIYQRASAQKHPEPQIDQIHEFDRNKASMEILSHRSLDNSVIDIYSILWIDWLRIARVYRSQVRPMAPAQSSREPLQVERCVFRVPGSGLLVAARKRREERGNDADF